MTKGRPEKQIEALHCLAKLRELKLFKRKEILNVVRSLCGNPALLDNLQPFGYFNSLVYATMKMKIDDPLVWTLLADAIQRNLQ